MSHSKKRETILQVARATASVRQAVRTILEAYTAREIADLDIVYDQDDRYAVRLREDEHYIVNLTQWNNGVDLDVVCNEAVEEVVFTSWPPVRRS